METCNSFLFFGILLVNLWTLPQASTEISIVYGWLFNFLPTVISVFLVLTTNMSILYKLVTKKTVSASNPLPSTVIKNEAQDQVETLQLRQLDSVAEDGRGSVKRGSERDKRGSIAVEASNKPRNSIANIKAKLASTRVTLGRGMKINGQSKTLLLLALVYLICYVQKLFLYGNLVSWPNRPFHELLLPYMSRSAAAVFTRVSDNCVTVNSFLNPLIYLAFSRRVRREFVGVLACRTEVLDSTRSRAT